MKPQLQIKRYRSGVHLQNAKDRNLSAKFVEAVNNNDVKRVLEILKEPQTPQDQLLFETVLKSVEELAARQSATPTQELLFTLFTALDESWDDWQATRQWEIKKRKFAGEEKALTRENFVRKLCCTHNRPVLGFVLFGSLGKFAQNSVTVYECANLRSKVQPYPFCTQLIVDVIHDFWPASKKKFYNGLMSSIAESNVDVFKELITLGLSHRDFCIDEKVLTERTLLNVAVSVVRDFGDLSTPRAKIIETLLNLGASPIAPIWDSIRNVAVYSMLTQKLTSDQITSLRSPESRVDLLHCAICQLESCDRGATQNLLELLLCQGFEKSFVSHETKCCENLCILCTLANIGLVDMMKQLADLALAQGVTLKHQKSCDTSKHKLIAAILMNDEAQVQLCVTENEILRKENVWYGCGGYVHPYAGRALFLALFLRRRKLVWHLFGEQSALCLIGDLLALSIFLGDGEMLRDLMPLYHTKNNTTSLGLNLSNLALSSYVRLLRFNTRSLYCGAAVLSAPLSTTQIKQHENALGAFFDSPLSCGGLCRLCLTDALETGHEHVIEIFLRNGARKLREPKFAPLEMQIIRRLWRKNAAEFIGEKVLCKELVDIVLEMVVPTNDELENMFCT
jgi:hypothetical protein